jgi:hypothetical protein
MSFDVDVAANDPRRPLSRLLVANIPEKASSTAELRGQAGFGNWIIWVSFVKYLIEIVRASQGAGVEVLHRLTVDEMKLQRVQFRAENLLSVWRRRGATGLRISNHRGEELQSWDIS